MAGADKGLDCVKRYVVEPVTLPWAMPGGLKNFPCRDLVLVSGQASGVKGALMAALTAENFRVREVVWGKTTGRTGGNCFEVAVSPQKFSHGELNHLVCRSGERVGAIIHLEGAGEPEKQDSQARRNTLGFFTLLKAFEKDLVKSAQEGGGRVFAVTFLGGCYGFTASHDFFPESAGVLGVTKSMAMEYPLLRCRCIDVDPAMGAALVAAKIWEEIQADEPSAETGLDRQGRWKVGLREDPGPCAGPAIGPKSVILLLGGASGITQVIACALARKYKPVLILAGRTPLSAKISIEMDNLPNAADLKSHFIKLAKIKKKKTMPAEIDQRIADVLKNRRLRANLEELKAAGARVEYHALDVRDEAVLGDFIENIYQRYKQIDGVVHGAGIIADQRIRDKSNASFCAVYDTKIIPARILEKKLRPSGLKFMVFFSSVAARFGNAGQSDYAAANEVLNKLAHKLAKKWPRTRVVSIGWGPWDAGMVNSGLKTFYEKKGIGLIPPAAGAQLFLNELGTDGHLCPEIVITSAMKLISGKGLGQAPI